MNERFPLSFWNYRPIESVTADEAKLWADCGMTLIMSPEYHPSPENKARMLALLDECERLDMRVIMCDQRTYWRNAATDPEGYRARYREAYADFGSHPAVYGFHIGDEPFRKHMDDVAKAVSIQREEAPELTPFINFLPTWNGEYAGYESYEKCFDDINSRVPLTQVCYDRYSQMNPEERGTDEYFTDLRRYSELAQRMNIPCWTTLLCVGHFRYRVPSEDDLRWQLSTAVASGYSGILWFMFYLNGPHSNYRKAPINMFGEKTETYYALRDVLRTFNANYADIFKRLKLTGCYHIGRAWGGYPLFTGDTDPDIIDIKSHHGVDAIVSFFTDENGKKYVALTSNSKTESGQFAMTIRKSAGRMLRAGLCSAHTDVQLYFHDEGLNDLEDTFIFHPWLAPGQLNLYMFEK